MLKRNLAGNFTESLNGVLLLFLITLVVAVIPSLGIHWAIPLIALVTTFSIAIIGKMELAWRWAALASGLWFIEETIWAFVRLQGLSGTEWLTDIFYFAGAAVWLIALHLMPYRLLPGRNMLFGLPIVVFLLWILAQSPRSLSLNFPIVETLLFFYSIPALEAAFQGRVSEGRILWGFGFFVRALSSGLYAWLSPQGGTEIFFYWLSFLSYSFILIGSWLELTPQPANLVDGCLFSDCTSSHWYIGSPASQPYFRIPSDTKHHLGSAGLFTFIWGHGASRYR